MKKISILIAVRNEEKVILSCLQNLKKSINEFYKKEENKDNFEIEILLGDDNDKNTKDKSAEIIKKFVNSNECLNYKYFKIEENNYNLINQNNLKGKANVIHQLINHSKGETIILLDADILVNKDWLTELVTNYYKSEKIKMVMGTTIPTITNKLNLCHCWCFSEATPTIKATTILAKRHQQQILSVFQTIDWILGQGVLAIFSKLGFPQTAMGNNLIFDRNIYQEIGGYENIEFSVTEDVALFKAFQNHLKTPFFVHLFNSNSLAFTEPEPTLKEWILQRHRWFSGAWQFSNSFGRGFLLIYLFRIIFFIGIILTINNYLILFILISLGINYLLIISFFVKLKLKISASTLLSVFIFFITEPFLYALVAIYFLKTKKVKWKEREF